MICQTDTIQNELIKYFNTLPFVQSCDIGNGTEKIIDGIFKKLSDAADIKLDATQFIKLKNRINSFQVKTIVSNEMNLDLNTEPGKDAKNPSKFTDTTANNSFANVLKDRVKSVAKIEVPEMLPTAPKWTSIYLTEKYHITDLSNPWAVTYCPADDLLYVADRCNDRIVVVQRNGNLVTYFGQKGCLPLHFQKPSSVKYDKRLDRLIIVDKDNHRIQVIAREGYRHLFSFGQRGSASSNFDYPWDCAIDS